MSTNAPLRAPSGRSKLSKDLGVCRVTRECTRRENHGPPACDSVGAAAAGDPAGQEESAEQEEESTEIQALNLKYLDEWARIHRGLQFRASVTRFLGAYVS